VARIAVTGGTGFVGRHVVGLLLERGHTVRVLARDAEHVPFPRDRVAVVPGSVADAAALAQLLAGVDTLVHLVGIIAERGAATFAAIHVEAAQRVADAARTAGAARIVHMSALGARSERAATAYHRSKAAGEAAVRAAGLPHVILRPALIVGPESVPLRLLARLHRHLPAVPVFGDGRFPMQPIWIGDVAAAFARAAEGLLPEGTYDIGGPDQVTYADFVRAIGAVIGRPRPLVHVPLGLVRVAARGFDILPAHLAPITSDQLQMLVEGSATPADGIRQVLGAEPLPLGEGLRRVARAWRENP